VIDDRVLRLRREVRFRNVGGEGVVLRQEAREVLVVNGVGARVLELLDGRRSVAEVAAVLREERDAPPEAIERDVEAFVDELLAAGVVEMQAAGR
jgi:pyrroloquinoline quinone biosynthesis protein D